MSYEQLFEKTGGMAGILDRDLHLKCTKIAMAFHWKAVDEGRTGHTTRCRGLRLCGDWESSGGGGAQVEPLEEGRNRSRARWAVRGTASGVTRRRDE